MDIFLPEGFEPSQTRTPKSRPARNRKLSVEAGGIHYPILRRWETGFAAAADKVSNLSGVVNMFEGAEHVHQLLITGQEVVDDQVVFSVKQAVEPQYNSRAEGKLRPAVG
ncbi:hypothetical protein [Sulfitobacter donghicola]|uniref:Uncharacterized protein n=1 Tax=Sulfitobacter donghicola DSW-25 = KCTC 12864 = JCM 14565 TaxID=1300350 RepID=A0A073INC8_9RHOB|nr:hypothetical protein [Sulfitobacter donghicola]KEJ90986.1 hypothetical protein DSW25_03575 [Sulfitobacter donghicola DSW-25 = KCTC 12864 = JCM 14565]KIN68280.1 hypothetical protein Z948_2009 [Sulfitobacter donghicola DSW-25 = KCTC 12864 = JCM 14565]